MNERIKQLAEQANFTEQDIEDMSPGFEKFAELIVEECMEQVYYGREEVLNGNISEVIQQRIKQHFGVEE